MPSQEQDFVEYLHKLQTVLLSALLLEVKADAGLSSNG